VYFFDLLGEQVLSLGVNEVSPALVKSHKVLKFSNPLIF